MNNWIPKIKLDFYADDSFQVNSSGLKLTADCDSEYLIVHYGLLWSDGLSYKLCADNMTSVVIKPHGQTIWIEYSADRYFNESKLGLEFYVGSKGLYFQILIFLFKLIYLKTKSFCGLQDAQNLFFPPGTQKHFINLHNPYDTSWKIQDFIFSFKPNIKNQTNIISYIFYYYNIHFRLWWRNKIRLFICNT